jgi:hypothetical protein
VRGAYTEVAKNLNRETNAVREEKGDKLKESDVQEKVEKICDVETVEGEWLIKHDLVEEGDALTMKFMDGAFGACNSECKTMQKACVDIIGDRDLDIAQALFTDQTMKRAALSSFLCNSKARGLQSSTLQASTNLLYILLPHPATAEATT